MRTLWLILAGATGGVLGGMGLGGGTLLMPILTFFLSVPPRLAAWVNLVAFLPTATVALFFHLKNGLIDKRAVFFLLAFAFSGVAAAFLFGKGLSDGLLRRVFGWVLIFFGAASTFSVLVGYFKEKR